MKINYLRNSECPKMALRGSNSKPMKSSNKTSSPENTYEYYLKQGSHWEHRRAWIKAEQAYQAALGLDTRRLPAYQGLARVNMLQGKYYQAIHFYSQLLQVQPSNFMHLHNRGLAWREVERYESALEDFNQAIEQYPEYELAYLNRGITHYRRGDLRLAEQDFQTAEAMGSLLAWKWRKKIEDAR